MKKSAWFGLLLFLFVSSNLLAAEREVVALVVKATDAFVQLQGEDEESTLTQGTRLADGDRLRTGPEGRVVLIFIDDKSQLKMQPETAILLRATRKSSGIKKEIELSMGDLWSRITKQGSEFRVVTSTSVASVKGTSWWTRVVSEDEVLVITQEGVVEVLARQSGESILVPAGNSCQSDGSTLIVQPTSSENLDGLNLGELRRMEIPVTDDGQPRTVVIEYYE
jgi:hypothetical protein